MTIEELFLVQVGAAMQYSGRPASWEALEKCMTDVSEFLAVANDPRVHPLLADELRTAAKNAGEFAEEALRWIRTVELLELLQKHPGFKEKKDHFWSTTAQLLGWQASSSSQAL